MSSKPITLMSAGTPRPRLCQTSHDADREQAVVRNRCGGPAVQNSVRGRAAVRGLRCEWPYARFVRTRSRRLPRAGRSTEYSPLGSQNVTKKSDAHPTLWTTPVTCRAELAPCQRGWRRSRGICEVHRQLARAASGRTPLPGRRPAPPLRRRRREWTRWHFLRRPSSTLVQRLRARAARSTLVTTTKVGTADEQANPRRGTTWTSQGPTGTSRSTWETPRAVVTQLGGRSTRATTASAWTHKST